MTDANDLLHTLYALCESDSGKFTPLEKRVIAYMLRHGGQITGQGEMKAELGSQARFAVQRLVAKNIIVVERPPRHRNEPGIYRLDMEALNGALAA